MAARACIVNLPIHVIYHHRPIGMVKWHFFSQTLRMVNTYKNLPSTKMRVSLRCILLAQTQAPLNPISVNLSRYLLWAQHLFVITSTDKLKFLIAHSASIIFKNICFKIPDCTFSGVHFKSEFIYNLVLKTWHFQRASWQYPSYDRGNGQRAIPPDTFYCIF